MVADDRPAIAQIVTGVGNFNDAEIECALELVDIYLQDRRQRDYQVIIAETEPRVVCGYACWGPTPLTRGTYDLYWIATSPAEQGKGVGRTLMSYIEGKIREMQGRLLVVETSSKDSYRATVGFYRRLGYDEAVYIRDFYDRGDDKLIFIKRFQQ